VNFSNKEKIKEEGMKRYTEYTQDELATFDEDGVQRLIDIEIAVAGIVPVAAPLPLNAERLGISKSVQGFQVQGTIYETREDAEIARGLKIMQDDYECSAGWNYRYLMPVESVEIKVVQFYRKKDVVENAGRLRDLNNQKDKYDRENNAYGDYLKAIGGCRDAVKEAVADAWAWKRRIEAAEEVYASYVKLAEGDIEVAKNFFLNTYKGLPDLIEAVLGPQLDPDVPDLVRQDEEQAAG
jgi:hypothetical protein